MEELFYFRVARQERFHVLNELLLHFPASSEIEMEVDGCGLDVVMAEVVFDIRKRLAAQEHIDSPGVTEAVNGMYRF